MSDAPPLRRDDPRRSRRMLRIVEDLMSLSRIEADRFRPRRAGRPGEVARIAIEHAAPPLADRARGCRSRREIEETCPPCAAISAAIAPAADNLIGNALRYGCTDGRCVTKSRCAATGRVS
jgi:two-component system phosphate regulon sensor histidine kinase PhoR